MCILSTLICCMVSLPANFQKPTDLAQIQAIRDTFAANLSAVGTFGACTFSAYDGLLNDNAYLLTEDLAAQPRTRMSEGHGRFLFSGEFRLIEKTYSLEELLKNSTKREAVIRSHRSLTDGTMVLVDHPSPSLDRRSLAYHPSLTTPAKHKVEEVEFPWNFRPVQGDMPNLAGTLEAYMQEPGRWTLVSLDPEALLRESRVTRLELISQQDQVSCRFWIDMNRGAIPLRTIVTSLKAGNGLLYAEENEDVRQIGDRGWLPFRRLRFQPNWPESTLRPGEGMRFWEMEVESANLDSRPDLSQFYLEFPQPISILNEGTGILYPPAQRWNLGAISPKAAARGKPAQTPYVPPARWFPWLPEREWWQNGLMLFAFGLFAGYGAFLYWQSKRKPAS